MTDLAIAMLVFSLAGWTVMDLLVFQHGPFGILERLRELAGSHARDKSPLDVMDAFMRRNPHEDPDDLPDRLATSELGELFSCPWCMSIWVALALSVGAVASLGLSWGLLPVIWLALRGLIMLWERIIRG